MLVAAVAPPQPPPPPPPNQPIGPGGGEGNDGGGPMRRKKDSKGKGKAAPRFKWPNDMVAELLRLRFKDSATKAMVKAADTPLKKALAWQHIASVLSQSMGIVVRDDQVAQKYRKLKCIYQKEKRELLVTGNGARETPIDEQLWEILTDGFGSHSGVSGDILIDSDLYAADHEDGRSGDDTTSDAPIAGASRQPPVVQLATALQSGMEAITSSLASHATSDNALDTLARILQQQHEETRRFQQLELQLLRQLLGNKDKENPDN